jgi:hypothetical protein
VQALAQANVKRCSLLLRTDAIITGLSEINMIPKEKITEQHVLEALSEIDRTGVPENRQARSFDLSRNDKVYPPKYVLSLASKYATGQELHPSEFSGGEVTNGVLRALGFDVVARAQQPIRDGLEKVMDQYLDARAKGVFGKEHPIWNVFLALQRNLRGIASIQENLHIKAKWSVGQGNWSKVPWIALMDDRETDSTQQGVSCAFLFRQDMTGVYLTLVQGVTEPRKRLGARDARQFINSVATEIRAKTTGLQENGFRLDDNVQLNADAQLGAEYEGSVIAYKLYEKGSVPNDDTIEADVTTALNAYQEYIDGKHSPQKLAQHWLFQANPQFYDLKGSLKTLNQTTWLVSAYKTEIRKGAFVYLWESGSNAGILAKGTIITDPTEMNAMDAEKAFTRDESKFAGQQTRVVIHIDQVLRSRLRRQDLLQDEVLQSLVVIKFANATNFKVTQQESVRIEELIHMQNGNETAITPLTEFQRLTFLDISQIDEIGALLLDKKQIIFEGPPGSGNDLLPKN